MSQKLIIGITLIAIFSCVVIVPLTQGLWKHLTDTIHVNSVVQGIADFDLPSGYNADYAVSFLGYTMASYISDDERSHITLLQAPKGVIPNEQTMSGHVTGTTPEITWRETTTLDTEQLIIRDEPATLTMSERVNLEGQNYRQLNMVFEGKSGRTLLVINQPASQWDDGTITAFINSIH